MGTRGFSNGEQGIKSKKVKGSWEHAPPPLEGLQIALGLVHIYGYELIKMLSTGKQECSHTIAVFIKAND